MMMNEGYCELTPLYGYYLTKLPSNLFNEIDDSIKEIQSGKNNTRTNINLLQVENQYLINIGEQFKHYTKNIASEYEKHTGEQSDILNAQFDDVWVNFARQNEYSGIHHHRGIYSFVIWYQVPYTLEEQAQYAHNENYKSGDFLFHFPTFRIGKVVLATRAMQVDKSKEGYMVLFPTSLNHAVYPFYSNDGTRVSIAGNIL
jgi:hypothetical protein